MALEDGTRLQLRLGDELGDAVGVLHLGRRVGHRERRDGDVVRAAPSSAPAASWRWGSISTAHAPDAPDEPDGRPAARMPSTSAGGGSDPSTPCRPRSGSSWLRPGSCVRTDRCGRRARSPRSPTPAGRGRPPLGVDVTGTVQELVDQGTQPGVVEHGPAGRGQEVVAPDGHEDVVDAGNHTASCARIGCSGRPSGNHTFPPVVACSSARSTALRVIST